MVVIKTIETKLRAAFSPIALEIVDESSRHAGHTGSRPGGETHFRIEIVSDAFEGLSRLARQRAIHHALAAELAGPVHALAVHAIASSERVSED